MPNSHIEITWSEDGVPGLYIRLTVLLIQVRDTNLVRSWYAK